VSSDPYVSRVVLEWWNGQGDPGGYVLVGSSADLRTVLDDILAGVARVERDPARRAHDVRVGDGSGRFDYVYLGVRIDPDVARRVRRRRPLWRFYDSQIAGLFALIIVILTFLGAHTVWGWMSARFASAS
jgi:hypothetical protein